jgi:hypothetical protein
MAIVNQFYNATTKKYVALFGSIFNKISIVRYDQSGQEVQRMVVPISYGPYQKFLARVVQDSNLDRKTAITLPRMSFEITGMTYDGTRKVNSIKKLRAGPSDDMDFSSFQYSPTPYNIDFSLSIMTKYAEDGTQILEQIIPFFKPEWTTTVKLIDNIEPLDIPLVLSGVNLEDVYEGDFITRRSLLWTLTFTMKAWYFGPTRDRKVIKLIDTRYYASTDANAPVKSIVTLQPGLTANGEPTTDIDESVSYDEIIEDDDWGVIILKVEPTEES